MRVSAVSEGTVCNHGSLGAVGFTFPVPTGVVGWLVALCVAMLTMWPAQIGAVLWTPPRGGRSGGGHAAPHSGVGARV